MQQSLRILCVHARRPHDVQHRNHLGERASDAIDCGEFTNTKARKGRNQQSASWVMNRFANVVKTTPILCSFTRAYPSAAYAALSSLLEMKVSNIILYDGWKFTNSQPSRSQDSPRPSPGYKSLAPRNLEILPGKQSYQEAEIVVTRHAEHLLHRE